MMPLYEAKMIHQFDHRWATYHGEDVVDVPIRGRADPSLVVLPRYWVAAGTVEKRLPPRGRRGWLLGFRDIARNTDERTVITSPFPTSAVGNNLPLIAPAEHVALLPAILTAFVVDFAARPKVGGVHLNFFIANQLPVATPDRLNENVLGWSGLKARVLELGYTAWNMAPFAEDLGDVDATDRICAPFVWDEERRFWLRAELDASFFHLYGLARDDVDYIMDTFPIVRRKNEAAHGEYRTKRVILELFDAMQTAIATGVPYASPLDPPPGHGPRHPAHSRRGAA